MNKVSLLIASIFVFFIEAKSQDVDSTVARTFADKLKDSLSLTQVQADSIFSISKSMRIEKKQVWSQYRGTPQLNQKMLEEDNKRDSLFRDILGEEKYNLYTQRRWHYLMTN